MIDLLTEYIPSMFHIHINHTPQSDKYDIISTLPIDLFMEICYYLPPIDLCRLAQCCRLCRDIGNSNELWWLHCKTLFNGLVNSDGLINDTMQYNRPRQYIDYNYIDIPVHNQYIVDSSVLRSMEHNHTQPDNNNKPSPNRKPLLLRSYKQRYIECSNDLCRTFISQHELCDMYWRFEFNTDLFSNEDDIDYYPVWRANFQFAHYSFAGRMNYRFIDTNKLYSTNHNNIAEDKSKSFLQRIFQNHIGVLTRSGLRRYQQQNNNTIHDATSNSMITNINQSTINESSLPSPTTLSNGLIHYPIGTPFSQLTHLQQIDQQVNRNIAVSQYPSLKCHRDQYGRFILTNQFVRFTSVHNKIDHDYQRAVDTRRRIDRDNILLGNRHDNGDDDIDTSDTSNNDDDMIIDDNMAIPNAVNIDMGATDHDVIEFLYDQVNRHGNGAELTREH